MKAIVLLYMNLSYQIEFDAFEFSLHIEKNRNIERNILYMRGTLLPKNIVGKDSHRSQLLPKNSIGKFKP